jgi:hypothetical protein
MDGQGDGEEAPSLVPNRRNDSENDANNDVRLWLNGAAKKESSNSRGRPIIDILMEV